MSTPSTPVGTETCNPAADGLLGGNFDHNVQRRARAVRGASSAQWPDLCGSTPSTPCECSEYPSPRSGWVARPVRSGPIAAQQSAASVSQRPLSPYRSSLCACRASPARARGRATLLVRARPSRTATAPASALCTARRCRAASQATPPGRYEKRPHACDGVCARVDLCASLLRTDHCGRRQSRRRLHAQAPCCGALFQIHRAHAGTFIQSHTGRGSAAQRSTPHHRTAAQQHRGCHLVIGTLSRGPPESLADSLNRLCDPLPCPVLPCPAQ